MGERDGPCRPFARRAPRGRGRGRGRRVGIGRARRRAVLAGGPRNRAGGWRDADNLRPGRRGRAARRGAAATSARGGGKLGCCRVAPAQKVKRGQAFLTQLCKVRHVDLHAARCRGKPNGCASFAPHGRRARRRSCRSPAPGGNPRARARPAQARWGKPRVAQHRTPIRQTTRGQPPSELGRHAACGAVCARQGSACRDGAPRCAAQTSARTGCCTCGRVFLSHATGSGQQEREQDTRQHAGCSQRDNFCARHGRLARAKPRRRRVAHSLTTRQAPADAATGTRVPNAAGKPWPQARGASDTPRAKADLPNYRLPRSSSQGDCAAERALRSLWGRARSRRAHLIPGPIPRRHGSKRSDPVPWRFLS